jgi:hypothetical protein
VDVPDEEVTEPDDDCSPDELVELELEADVELEVDTVDDDVEPGMVAALT